MTGYGDATDAIAAQAPRRFPYDEGLDDLTRDVAHYPPDYRQTFSGLAPQVQDSRAAGLRMAVEQAVGTKENDLQALRNATQGANGWNSQNLGHVFGQAPVDNVNRDIAAELRMRDTYGKVTQNAETARRTAMAKALADSESKPWEIRRRTTSPCTGWTSPSQSSPSTPFWEPSSRRSTTAPAIYSSPGP